MATELSEQEERASRFLESIQARSRLADERREAYSAIYATFRSNEDVERHRKSLSKDAFKEALEARRPLVEDMMERNRKQMNDALDVLVLRKRPTPTAASQQANLNPSDIAAMLSHTSNPSSSSSSSSISQPMRSTTRIISARPLINNNINDKDNRDRQGDGRKEESNGGGGEGGEGLIESDEMFARRLHEEELRSIQGSVSSDREMAPPQRLRTSDNSIPINQRNTMISSSSSSSMMAMADEDEELARALALSVEQEQQQGGRGGGGLYDVEMDERRGGGSRPSSSSVPVATRIAPNATSIYGSTSSATNPPVAQMVAFAPGRSIASSTVNRSSINPTSSSSSSSSFSFSSSSSSVQPLSRSPSITAVPSSSSSSLLPVRSSAPSIQFGAAGGGGGGRGSSSSSSSHHIVLEGGSIRMAQKADKPSSSLSSSSSSSTTSIRTNGRLTADERLAAARNAAAAATTNSSSSTLLPKKK